MTCPTVHELATVVHPTGHEIFDIDAYTRGWIVLKLLIDAPCLDGHEKTIKITSTQDSAIGSTLYQAKALCPTPDTCSATRKARP